MTTGTNDRWVEAIACASKRDLQGLVDALVDAERATGHPILAQAMTALGPQATDGFVDRLVRAERTGKHAKPGLSSSSLDGLVTLVLRERLEHDMVLPDAIEGRLRRVEQEWAARDRLALHGLRPRQRILLHGPWGCGKTLAASRLAWNCGLSLAHVRAGALVAGAVAAVFGHARATASVLVLDECERLVVAESGRAALLQQLDEGVGRSVLVATTSNLGALDAAVLGRFDEVVELPLPAVAEVERLLRMSLSAMRCEAGMPWAELARACVGQSAAAAVRAAREAGKAAVLQGGAVVTSGMLREAVVAFGEVRES